MNFEAVLAGLPDAVIAVDLDGKVVFWNAAAEELTARSARRAVGRTLKDIVPFEDSLIRRLREQMSFVLQDTVLFQVPIWQNIAYGKPEAKRAEIIKAAELANADEFIKEMPEGPEKAKAFAAYHKMIGKLYVTLCEVEEAFLNGKIDEVAKLVDAVKEMKKAGHKEFVKEDE